MSPLDPRIPLGVQAPQMPNPLEIVSTISQIQAQREAVELRRLAADEARTKRMRQEQVDAAITSAITVDDKTGRITLDKQKIVGSLPQMGAAALDLQKWLDTNEKDANELIQGRVTTYQQMQKALGGLAATVNAAAPGGDEAVAAAWRYALRGAKSMNLLDEDRFAELSAMDKADQILPLARGFMQSAGLTPKLEKVTTYNAATGETVEQFVVPTEGATYTQPPKTENLPSYQDVDAIVTFPNGRTYTGKVGYNPKANVYAPIGSTTPFPQGTKVERAPTPPNETVEAIRALTLANLQKGKDAMTPAQFAMATRLADDYTMASKDYIVRAQAYQTIQQAAANPSAAGDLVMIFAFMKQNDPGSTVREGEQATAQNAAGIPEQVRNLYNRVMTGQRLSPEQRKDFLNQSRLQMTQAQQRQRGLLTVYTQRAQNARLNPADVVIDYDQVFGLSTADPNAPPPPFSVGPPTVQPPTTGGPLQRPAGANPFATGKK